MKKRVYCLAGLSIAVCLALAVLPACEDAKGTRPLGLVPVYTVLSGDTNYVVFTVNSNDLRELSLPLKWWVENERLGDITQSGGVNAVYSSRGKGGVNVVWVRDQYDAEGSATVEQK